MDFVKIAGEKREVILIRKDVNKFIKTFNNYYILATQKARQNEDHFLIKINEEKNPEKKMEMMNQMIDFIEDQLSKVSFPYFIIEDIIWKILSQDEKRQFKNRFGRVSKKKMIDSIRVDEYQPIVDFVGSKILNLSGYNKKKDQVA